MGILDSIWEEVEDFGSTAWEGVKDVGSTANRLYEDDFLKKLESGTSDFLTNTENLMKTDDYQEAARWALKLYAGNQLNAQYGEGSSDMVSAIYDMFNGGGSNQQSAGPDISQTLSRGPVPTRGEFRSSSYSPLISRLNNLVNQIDPYEEIETPIGARY